MLVLNCRQCLQSFQSQNPRKVYCDRKCLDRWHDEHRADRGPARREAYARQRQAAGMTRVGDVLTRSCLECTVTFSFEIGKGRGRRPELCSVVCRRRRRRRAELQQKYSVELERYEEMWTAQDGLCRICSKGLLSRSKDSFAAVDHCHQTGRVRGLLCLRCNLAIGQFGDDPALLLRAAEYLSTP